MNQLRKLTLVLTICCLISSTAFGAPDFGVELVGYLPSNGWDVPQDIEFSNGFLFVACGNAGLRILDASNPDSLIQVGFYDATIKNAVQIEVQDGFAYVLDQLQYNSAIHILDVSDVRSPRPVSRIYPVPSNSAIQVLGDYLYYSSSDGSGFITYSIADPAHPHIISTYPGVATSIFYVSNSKAYINAAGGSLAILDLSDPERPTQTVYIRGGQIAGYNSLTIRDSLAFTSAGQIIDVSNPASPRVRGRAAIQGTVYAVDIWGNDFVTVGDQVSVVDASNPDAPVVEFEGAIPLNRGRGIAIEGTHLYTGFNTGVRAFNWTEEERYHAGKDFRPGSGFWNTLITGNLAIIPYERPRQQYAGFNVIDLSNPVQVHQIGEYNGYITPPFAVGSERFMARTRDRNIGWFDLSDPAQPSLIGEWQLPEGTTAIASLIADGYVYISDRNGVLYIAQATANDQVPSLIGSCQVGEGISRIVIKGDVAFVRMADRIAVVDLEDRENPQIIRSQNMPEPGWMTFWGDDHFVCVSEGILNFYDISDLQNFVLLGQMNVGGYHLSVSGNHLFTIYNSLTIYSLADLANPRLVGYMDTPGIAHDIAVAGNLAYVAGNTNLGIFDCSEALSDTAKPDPKENNENYGLNYEKSMLGTWTNPKNIAYSGSLLLVAAGSAGLQVFDVSELANPRLIGSFETGYDVTSVAVQEDFAIIGDADRRATFLDLSDPTQPRALMQTDRTRADAIAIKGNLAVIGGYPLSVYDVSDRENPTLIGQAQDEQWEAFVDLMIVDDMVYALQFENTLSTFDVSDPSHPWLIGSINLGEEDLALSLCRQDDLLYAATYSKIFAFDIANRRAPDLYWTYEEGEDIGVCYSDIAAWGSYLFVAGQRECGTTILDLREAPTPERLEILPLDFVALAATDAVVYGLQQAGASPNGESHWAPGIETFNYSDGAGYVNLASYHVSGEVSSVKISGEYAYALLPKEGIVCLDASNPNRLRETSRYEFPEGYWSSFITRGSLLFGAADSNEVQIVDFSDPALPELIGSWRGRDPIVDLAVRDTLLYVLTWRMKIVDIADPSHPTEVGQILGLDDVGQSVIQDTLLYVLDHRNLSIFGLTDPLQPALLSRSPGGTCKELIIQKDRLFASIPDKGVYVYNLSRLEAPSLQLILPAGIPSFGNGDTGGILAVCQEESGVKLYDFRDPVFGGEEIARFNTSGDARAAAFLGPRLLVADATNLGVYVGDFPNAVEDQSVQPTSFSFNLYPNPTNSSLSIEYNVLKPSGVTCRLYDLQGRVGREILDNAWRSPGAYHTGIEVGDLSSGLYYLLLETDAGRGVKKAVVLK